MSGDEWFEKALALAEGAFAVGEVAFVGSVFNFDANGSVVAGVGECGEEGAPVDVAEPGEFGLVPAESEDTDFVEFVVVDAFVFGVDVDDLFAELAECACAVDLLPDEVGGIEVESDGHGGERLEEAPPDGGVEGDVFSAGPFVLAEEHGAMFDADLHIVRLGEFEDGRPDLGDHLEVLLDGFLPVATDEGVDDFDSAEGCGLNELFEVGGDEFAVCGVGVERVGVVAESGDGDAVFGGEVLNAEALFDGEV